ncbi:MAG: hypothetical protein EAZ91_04700 [Cytophagales bacterium]|nr:MAG: hypothetical protein EAZ91_04700 [Cytophagales bacterium]
MKTRFILIALCLLGTQLLAQTKTNLIATTLLLNNRPIEAVRFETHTRGFLALAEGESGTSRRTHIPFRVMLRRGNTTVRQWTSLGATNAHALDLDMCMPHVWPGDELVVEPVGETGQKTQKTIKVPAFDWLAFMKPKGDGC